MFSQHIQATLIPTREELYPTLARTASCFFSDQDAAEEWTSISAGEGVAEWVALLAETRQEVAETKANENQVQPETELQKLQQRQKAKDVEARNLFSVFGVFPLTPTAILREKARENADGRDDRNNMRN